MHKQNKIAMFLCVLFINTFSIPEDIGSYWKPIAIEKSPFCRSFDLGKVIDNRFSLVKLSTTTVGCFGESSASVIFHNTWQLGGGDSTKK